MNEKEDFLYNMDVITEAKMNNWPIDETGSINWNINILQNYISKLFILFDIIPEPHENDDQNETYNMTINGLFDQEAMDNYWSVAFTDVSYDAIRNYENFEYVGDKILGHIFSIYCKERFNENFTPALGTILHSKYMDAKFQSQLAIQLGMDKFIRYNRRVTSTKTKSKGNIFESFFGCLEELGNKRIGPFKGTALCLNIIIRIFNQIAIDLATVKKHPIMRLKEYFEKQNIIYGVNQQTSTDQTKGRVKAIIVDESGIPFANEQGVPIGVGYGRDISEAEENASQNLLDYKQNIGMGEEVIESKMRIEKSQNIHQLDFETKRLNRLAKIYNDILSRKVGSGYSKINIYEGNVKHKFIVIRRESKKPTDKNLHGAQLFITFVSEKNEHTDVPVISDPSFEYKVQDAQYLSIKRYNDTLEALITRMSPDI